MDKDKKVNKNLTEIKPTYIDKKDSKQGSAKAILIVMDGWDEGMEFELEDFPVFIGRDESCNVCIPLPSVSRQHAVISWTDGKFILRDQKSTNGTYLNNKMVTEGQLKHGDEITVGEVTLKFIVEEKKENKVYIIDDK
jgi:pSer/pThr/pTyr-binding forkhead associated (FHA) protein